MKAAAEQMPESGGDIKALCAVSRLTLRVKLPTPWQSSNKLGFAHLA